jgi:peptidyl-prolyl cis-trans isomerase D
VLVSGARFAAPVSDADAEAYFKEHPAEFEKPRRVRGAHVLVRVPPVGGSEAEQGARAKAADVIKRAAAGADFAKLARERSEDAATAAQGGDLGFVRAGELVPEFERALFALTPGQVAPEPVRTPFGYHAIKAIAVEEGGRPPYREVAPRIKEKLLAERSDRAARDKADELRGALQGAADFAAESRRLGFEARAATLARGDSLEGIGHDVQLEEATFSLAVGGVGAPVKTAAGYAIVRIVERLAAGVPPLDEIKGAVRDAARRDKAEALALERATALVGALGQGGEFAALARGRGFTVGETPLYSRETPPKDSPLPGDVLAAALRTPTGQVAEPVKTPTGVFVVKTLERRAPDPAGFDAARAELEAQILGQKRNLVWERWLATLRAEAKVDLQPRLGLR